MTVYEVHLIGCCTLRKWCHVGFHKEINFIEFGSTVQYVLRSIIVIGTIMYWASQHARHIKCSSAIWTTRHGTFYIRHYQLQAIGFLATWSKWTETYLYFSQKVKFKKEQTFIITDIPNLWYFRECFGMSFPFASGIFSKPCSVVVLESPWVTFTRYEFIHKILLLKRYLKEYYINI